MSESEHTKAMEAYLQSCHSTFDALDSDARLKVFCAVIAKLTQAELVEGRSYRGILYASFGFGPESYTAAQEAGLITLHNRVMDNATADLHYQMRHLTKFDLLKLSGAMKDSDTLDAVLTRLNNADQPANIHEPLDGPELSNTGSALTRNPGTD